MAMITSWLVITAHSIGAALVSRLEWPVQARGPADQVRYTAKLGSQAQPVFQHWSGHLHVGGS